MSRLTPLITAMAFLLCGAAASGGTAGAAGGDLPAADINAVFGTFGFTETKKISPNGCAVDSILDQTKYLNSVPLLQSLQMLNPDITQTVINVKPNLLMMTFAMEMAPTVTRDVFEQNDVVSLCQFRQHIDDVDDYGNEQRKLIFSYRFDRQTSKKVNWDKFEYQNFVKIAPGFKFELWFMQKVGSETDL
jgi:hypothetical protein